MNADNKLPRSTTAKIFNVSLSTLHNWERMGLLVPFRDERDRPYYLLEQLQNFERPTRRKEYTEQELAQLRAQLGITVTHDGRTRAPITPPYSRIARLNETFPPGGIASAVQAPLPHKPAAIAPSNAAQKAFDEAFEQTLAAQQEEIDALLSDDE